MRISTTLYFTVVSCHNWKLHIYKNKRIRKDESLGEDYREKVKIRNSRVEKPGRIYVIYNVTGIFCAMTDEEIKSGEEKLSDGSCGFRKDIWMGPVGTGIVEGFKEKEGSNDVREYNTGYVWWSENEGRRSVCRETEDFMMKVCVNRGSAWNPE